MNKQESFSMINSQGAEIFCAACYQGELAGKVWAEVTL
jgi:hypothetical protein